MELATTLTSQTVQNAVRHVGINANYWYAVGWANRLNPSNITPVVIWQQTIAVSRDRSGQHEQYNNICKNLINRKTIGTRTGTRPSLDLRLWSQVKLSYPKKMQSDEGNCISSGALLSTLLHNLFWHSLSIRNHKMIWLNVLLDIIKFSPMQRLARAG